MTPDVFSAALDGHRISKPVRKALRAVLVEGSTWRDASHRFKVYESSIMRARDRIFGPVSPVMRIGPNDEVLLPGQYATRYETEVAAIVEINQDGVGTVKQRIIRG